MDEYSNLVIKQKTMKLTKRQIQRIKSAHKKAIKACVKFSISTQNLSQIIVEEIGIDGNVDYLAGDGFGFAPEPKDVHISVKDLIQFAENGTDITKDLILSNLHL